MSTPSGKPFDPFDISAYAPKRARHFSIVDRQDQEPISTEQDCEDDGVDPASFSVAKREWPGSQAEHPVDLDEGALPSFDVPPELSASEIPEIGEEPGIRAAEGAPEKIETSSLRHAEDGDDGRLKFADAPELVRDHSAPDLPAAKDEDIERLESSLRWLHREDASGRLPRAAQLPPTRGLSPARKPGRQGEAYINGFRLPRSLEPDFVPPPPIRARRDNLRGPIRILIASLIAAPIAYYFATGGLVPDSVNGRTAKFASAETRLPAYVPPSPPPGRSPPAAESLSEGSTTIGMLPPESKREIKPAVPASAAAAEPVLGNDGAPREQAAAPLNQNIASASVASVAKDTPRAMPGADQASVPKPSLRRLAPEDIKLLIQQGEQFVAAGDLVTARVVFQRAAEAGDAMGALAVGATYDPFVLAKLGARGIGADVEKARSWYEKARDFGSPEAPRRLEMLANR